MTPSPIITAQGLAKSFTVKKQRVDAVHPLDLEVQRGELLAFLGPNGAGKSTTLRMLTTLLPPSAGTASVVGFDVSRDPAEVRRRIGYIGQGNSAGHNQRVRDELISQGAFYGLGRVETARRADELIESLDLTAIASRGVMALSGGQKRRLDIALGLIHSPELLFLDEPSTGLDPQSRANLWRHIIDLRETHGTTIFVTTHYLEEADQFAERVMVMDHGRVIADDSAAELKTQLAGDVITLGFAGAAPAIPESTRVDDRTVTLTVDHGDRLLPGLIRDLDEAGTPVLSAAIRQPTLDDVFLALTGRSLRDEASTTTAPENEEVPA